MKKVVLLLVGVVAVLSTGCGKVVPSGTTVLVCKVNGESVTKSTGVYTAIGRDKVYFIDSKLKSFSKSMKVLCQDDINMDVSVKWVGSFYVTEDSIDVIRNKVPSTKSSRGDVKGYELSLSQFWSTAMEDIVSSITRNTVSEYKTDDIRPNRKQISAQIKKEILARLKELKYPVQTSDVLITNLDYPEEVTSMRKAIKNAELKQLEDAALAKAAVAKADRNAEVELAKGKAALVKAQADAECNRVRSESLTPAVLSVKQLETLVELAQGQNNNTVIIPFEALRTGLTDTVLMKQSLDK
jgi:regulator of protease activity HflC (stomatin/prohibitin superfamily)